MTSRISRRHFLQGAAGLAAVQLASHPGLAFAQSQSIVATTYPGAWESAHRGILLPAFTKATGASVSLTPSLAVDTVSKIVASRANPAFDVIILDEGPYLAAMAQDLFEPIPVDKVPNLKDVPASMVDPRGQGVFVSGQIIGIAYNTERIKTPPTSWNDLLKPEYKGRVGLAGMGSTLMSAWMVEIARLNGGDEENLEPAFEFVKKLLPNVSAVASNPGSLATLFQQGQIDISVHYNNNVGDLQGKGVPVALTRPDTGWIHIKSVMNIVKNTKNVDLAAAYIDAALSPEVQTQMAADPYFIVPVNTKAEFSKGLQAYASSMAEVEAMSGVDWEKLNPRRGEYIDRFNREVRV
ncbi:ABC transporter substrate-binding protein [Verticiella sediminum]|uniref:ABC transporter substrate-binding protein n=1 Tax=Verticiella sediminum TaxID=1247510 RepID=A0A556B1W0_9BURK|nr:ABC transporter substrate-binding protein [Verticiella sediminum]TSH99178.1 ABC transporter substrate-binding protein [Verticiella sediminum]